MYVRICSVQSDLVFDFSSPEDKGAGFDSNPLVGGNVRRSAESTFSAGGVPSGEHSGRVEGRGQASNRADMNRESKNGTYEDFSSVGANSRKAAEGVRECGCRKKYFKQTAFGGT